MLKKIWIYKKGSRIPVLTKTIPLKNLTSWREKGWSEWPIFTPEQFGLTKDDDLDVIGDLAKTVQTSLNQAINIPHLDEYELRAYALNGLGLEIDAFESVDDLRERILAA
jgi:hypothetical protein